MSNDSESREALLRRKRKSGATTLDRLFVEPNVSFDDELDRLNHDESFVGNQVHVVVEPCR
jgi:hypothetical protein